MIPKKKQNHWISEANNLWTYNIERLYGYPFIKPIMFVDDVCESDDLATIRTNAEGKTILKFTISQNASFVNPTQWLKR